MSKTPEIIYPPKPPEPDDDIDADYENWLASIGPDPEEFEDATI